jgi:hypothetical protein
MFGLEWPFPPYPPLESCIYQAISPTLGVFDPLPKSVFKLGKSGLSLASTTSMLVELDS